MQAVLFTSGAAVNFKTRLLLVLSITAIGLLAGSGGFSQHGPGHTAGGELKQGRYIGYVKLDDRQEKLALVADFYLESPEDFREFPRLNAMFKFSLGGYNTHEYFTEIFEDIKYDFDNGVLALDEGSNDFLMTAEVHTEEPDTFIMGQVFIRSSATSGTLYLRYQQPGTTGTIPDSGNPDTSPFIPTLDGEYTGRCGAEAAMVQIQTSRGLAFDADSDRKIGFDKNYRIVARFGRKSEDVCGHQENSRTPWCTQHNFESATVNLFAGKILLQSERRSEECRFKQGKLSCTIFIRDGVRNCEFSKRHMSSKPATYFLREFNVLPTPEQRRELPPAAPPGNTDLTAALRGNFTGYLHNEATNTYQIVRLNVMPYSSTNNPHNPNQMMVNTTGVSYLGKTAGENFNTHRYSPRSFYIRPGFTLNGISADSFINIVEWRRGLLRGVWYSHSFGRVGTVQLIKGNEVPAISSRATLVPSFVGQFTGPDGGGDSGSSSRWFNLIFPAQPGNLVDSLFHFTGSFQSIVDISPIEGITEGVYDPYSEKIAWLFARGGVTTLISGQVSSDRNIKLFWPPAPDVFGTLTSTYTLGDFRKSGSR
jgi:hypothetical protein